MMLSHHRPALRSLFVDGECRVSNVLKNKAGIQAFYLTHEVSFLSVSFPCLRDGTESSHFYFQKNI